MRIGFCSDFSEERVKFAAENGFDTIEVFCSEDGAIRPSWKKDDIKKAKDVFAKYNLWPMTVFHNDNYAAPDAAKVKQILKNAEKTMAICKEFKTNVMPINAFVHREGGVKGMIASYKKLYAPLAKMAEDNGIVVPIENCPHGGHNIAWSPEMWEIIFNEVPSKAIGLEYDPSHLVWLGVDYVSALYKFGERVYAFHAKDTEVNEEKLTWQGIMGHSWWRYRIPGWGDIDWNKIFTGLYEIGYKGDIAVEHEDPVFGGKRTDEGLRRSVNFLRDYTERQ